MDVYEGQQVTVNDDLLVNWYFLLDEYQKSAPINLDGPMPHDLFKAFSMPPAEQEHVVPCQKSIQRQLYANRHTCATSQGSIAESKHTQCDGSE